MHSSVNKKMKAGPSLVTLTLWDRCSSPKCGSDSRFYGIRPLLIPVHGGHRL